MFEELFQPTHRTVVPGIARLVFGPKKLWSLAKESWEGIGGFRLPL